MISWERIYGLGIRLLTLLIILIQCAV